MLLTLLAGIYTQSLQYITNNILTFVFSIHYLQTRKFYLLFTYIELATIDCIILTRKTLSTIHFTKKIENLEELFVSKLHMLTENKKTGSKHYVLLSTRVHKFQLYIFTVHLNFIAVMFTFSSSSISWSIAIHEGHFSSPQQMEQNSYLNFLMFQPNSTQFEQTWNHDLPR